ncbi:MAG TPA: BolA/IbaG family iron-sulfur metabolism protein [Azoarcus sp.]|nr:BolA/IbaG family iron-sulfur metabolism protein [Azoarcus sp.]
MFQASEIERLIKEGLDCELVTVEGDDGVHFSAIVVSPDFEGLSLPDQHRKVKTTLGNRLDSGEIHALGLKTYTPARWAALRASQAS